MPVRYPAVAPEPPSSSRRPASEDTPRNPGLVIAQSSVEGSGRHFHHEPGERVSLSPRERWRMFVFPRLEPCLCALAAMVLVGVAFALVFTLTERDEDT